VVPGYAYHFIDGFFIIADYFAALVVARSALNGISLPRGGAAAHCAEEGDRRSAQTVPRPAPETDAADRGDDVSAGR